MLPKENMLIMLLDALSHLASIVQTLHGQSKTMFVSPPVVPLVLPHYRSQLRRPTASVGAPSDNELWLSILGISDLTFVKFHLEMLNDSMVVFIGAASGRNASETEPQHQAKTDGR